MWVHCFIVLILQNGDENHREIKQHLPKVASLINIRSLFLKKKVRTSLGVLDIRELLEQFENRGFGLHKLLNWEQN